METNLYAQLAERVTEQIRQGSVQTGERLPSVRKMAEREAVSISTVMAAYGFLEQQGWIEARPKSGYFVKKRAADTLQKPSVVRAKPKPRPATVSQLMMDVRRARVPEHGNFSRSFPALDLPIVQQIKRTYARLSRTRSYVGVGYDSLEGLPELRQQIARRAVDSGIFVSPEAVISTSGCQNAMALCLRVLTQPGDIVAVESPCYYGLLQVIEAFGLKAIEIPAHPETGMSIEALQLALAKWPIKVILSVPTFSNPLGCDMPMSRREELMTLLERYDIPMIEDDIYGDLNFGERRTKAVKSLDGDGRVLLCSSLSKTVDPQLRVGWIMPGRYFEEVVYSKFVNLHTHSALPQMVAAELLAQGQYDRHLRQARDVYRQRYLRLADLVTAHFPAETRLSRPQGGIVAWLQFPETVNTTELYHRAKAEGILFAPGELFSISGQYKNCLRLGYSQRWTPESEESIRRLGQWVKEALHG